MFELNVDVKDAKLLNPLTLAFVGDSVFDLLVKQFLISKERSKVGELHKKATQLVCCDAQSKYMDVIWSILSDDEKLIYKRGRNCKTSHVPKQSSSITYHRATGFEALIGYLYLSCEKDRLEFIMSKILNKN